MKKTFYSVLVMTLGLTACDKDSKDLKEEVPPILVQATMTRTLDFTILGTKNDTTYTNKTRIKATARFGDDAPLMGAEKNIFLLSIDAGPASGETGAGDFVQFAIEPTKLSAGYVGTYRLDSQSDPLVKHIRYAYIKNSETGGYSASLAGTNMGNPMTGELIITHYDAVHNTLSGTYAIAGKLYSDPVNYSRVTRLDDECDLTVAGTFTNVKIKQN